ncbi:unnamed protein product [Toxocara canis]|uniref:RGS domain-containing protein n=1 Tax=Toxocara canis TaxID=6265 RepID=A0A183UBC0_TOXCA|nr:unnamed protein product [Toxocara canis]
MEQQQQQQQQQQRQQQQQQRHGHSPLMLVRSMVTPDGTPKLHKGMRDRAWSRSLTDLYEPQFHLSAFEDGAKRPTQKFDLRIKATVAFIRSKIKSADSNVMPLSQNEARQWQQSFQNLLSNKHGRELFRMFLVHEFSEENIDFWIECEEFRKMKEGKKQTEQRARDIYNKYLAAQAWKEVSVNTIHFSFPLIKKCSEHKLPLCIAFVDYEKAFDSVEINAVFQALVDQGVSSEYDLCGSGLPRTEGDGNGKLDDFTRRDSMLLMAGPGNLGKIQVNLDTLTRMSTKAAIGEGAGPNTFLVAQKKIESLMEKDSYRRFLKSQIFTDIFGAEGTCSSTKPIIDNNSLQPP